MNMPTAPNSPICLLRKKACLKPWCSFITDHREEGGVSGKKKFWKIFSSKNVTNTGVKIEWHTFIPVVNSFVEEDLEPRLAELVAPDWETLGSMKE